MGEGTRPGWIADRLPGELAPGVVAITELGFAASRRTLESAGGAR